MRRLILLVQHAAVVDVGHLVERQHVVELHLLRRMRMLVAEVALDALHPLVAGVSLQPVHHAEAAAARDDAQSRVDAYPRAGRYSNA